MRVACQIDEALLTASAFSNMLNLHNLSEEVANSQRERLQRLGEARAIHQPRGVGWLRDARSLQCHTGRVQVGRGQVKTTNGTLETLLDSGIPAATIYKALCEQTVDLVFTAHPTQALRRSMLKNFAAIRSELDKLNNMRLSRYEKLELQARKGCCLAARRCCLSALALCVHAELYPRARAVRLAHRRDPAQPADAPGRGARRVVLFPRDNFCRRAALPAPPGQRAGQHRAAARAG